MTWTPTVPFATAVSRRPRQLRVQHLDKDGSDRFRRNWLRTWESSRRPPPSPTRHQTADDRTLNGGHPEIPGNNKTPTPSGSLPTRVSHGRRLLVLVGAGRVVFGGDTSAPSLMRLSMAGFEDDGYGLARSDHRGSRLSWVPPALRDYCSRHHRQRIPKECWRDPRIQRRCGPLHVAQERWRCLAICQDG